MKTTRLSAKWRTSNYFSRTEEDALQQIRKLFSYPSFPCSSNTHQAQVLRFEPIATKQKLVGLALFFGGIIIR
jgi:hypothetical protein